MGGDVVSGVYGRGMEGWGREEGREVSAAAGDSDGQRAPFSVLTTFSEY